MDTEEDKYLALEDVMDESNLTWVKGENKRSLALVEDLPLFSENAALAKKMLDDPATQPRPHNLQRHGDHFYHFLEAGDFPRGLLRRCALDADLSDMTAVDWEPLLDIAKLNEKEGKSYTMANYGSIPGAFGNRMLVKLSDGGKDAVIIREFDLESKSFVDGPDGFNVLEEGKSSCGWIDHDTVLLHLAAGAEENMTSSGYARQVRLWKRGVPMAEAPVIFEGTREDVSVDGHCVHHDPTAKPVVILSRSLDFWNGKKWVYDLESGAKREFSAKRDIDRLANYYDKVLLELKKDWDEWKAGTLLVAEREDFLSRGKAALKVLFAPSKVRFLEDFTYTRSAVVCTVTEHVVSSLVEYRFKEDGSWEERTVKTLSPGSLTVSSLWDPEAKDEASNEVSNHYLVWYTDFTTPSTIFKYAVGSDVAHVVHQKPELFDASNVECTQHFATSKDGTRVPYFQIARKQDEISPRPTLLYGYGGFEVSMTPYYSGMYGKLWLERDHVWIYSNIRGGGEYGPDWHMGTLRENHQLCFDDFIAIAEHLIERKVTTPSQLGLSGGSNGGSLVAACMLQAPHLYRAVLCSCPLLDFKRYNKLLAGASWVAEYGDPDVEEDWEFLRKWSPYHNIPLAEKTKLPVVLFSTSTRDDRVHPGHSRKMFKRLREKGHETTSYLHERIEGGHSNAADNAQRAQGYALEFTFLSSMLTKKI